MNVVVIGGHTRSIGKTSVMAQLIRELKTLDWTAVKITQYGHGICSRDGQPCGCAPTEHPFALTEECDPQGRTDTSRFLAAGARRSLWLRARQGQLGEAWPVLAEALTHDDWVMVESNSILGFLKPTLYLMVLDASNRDFKASARQFLDRADALVTIRSAPDKGAWSDLGLGPLKAKPMFSLAPGRYFSPELCRFVRRRLNLFGASPQNAPSPAFWHPL